MGVSAPRFSSAAESAAPPRTSPATCSSAARRREIRTPRTARPSASISSTRLLSMAPITDAHFAVSISASHPPSTGSAARASRKLLAHRRLAREGRAQRRRRRRAPRRATTSAR